MHSEARKLILVSDREKALASLKALCINVWHVHHSHIAPTNHFFTVLVMSLDSSVRYSLIILPFFVIVISSASAQFKPRTALLSVRKDEKTLQYYTSLQISTRENYVQLVIDLGGEITWFDCDAYSLPTYKPISCGSTKCKQAKGVRCMSCNLPRKPGCTNNTCGVDPYNPFSRELYSLGIGEDVFYMVDTNGLSVGITYESPKPFPFSCVNSQLLRDLSNETKGLIGFANTTTSLHKHISTQFMLPHRFALCLPSSSEYPLGHMFVGGGPYYFLPYNKDVGKELITTPLVRNPLSTAPAYSLGVPSDEYFIDVKSISVGDRLISVNASLLSIDKEGNGGTKLSTVTPFAKLETSIYEGLVGAFTKAAELRKMKRVASVAPFGACYKAKTIATSQTGPVVPYIDFGVGKQQHWRFYGSNSMVSVRKDVLCLAFVDGGSNPRTSVVIGGHQMENYLIEFDLVSSKLGISTSLLVRNTTCTQSRLI